MDTTPSCKRCGRKINDPISIERGYGKTCWEKVQEQPDLIFLLQHGPLKTDYEKYKELLNRQVEKELTKVVV